ncbi:MAG: hypothetical protein ACFFA6_11820 [Promethearchaeota archaeon]
MTAEKRKFWTVGQIDATGVRGPHEKELEDISKAKYHLFIDIDNNLLEKIVREDLGGKIENIGLSEDWTITIKMFPEVTIHMAYSYFGNEFGDEIEAEFKFYFSGEYAMWVPGEDSATYIDVVMDYIDRQIKGNSLFEKSYNKKTEMMKKVLAQRSKPFKLLKEEDKEKLELFLGAKIWKTSNGWKIKREIFPSIFTNIYFDNVKGLNISFSGNNLKKISNYHLEFLGIFTINHVLRYITVNNLDKDLPDICYIMFSRYYTKLKNWDHRTR